MKIIFVGDSMGLPREGCEYEDTYFYKFQKEYKEIDCISFFKSPHALVISSDFKELLHTSSAKLSLLCASVFFIGFIS